MAKKYKEYKKVELGKKSRERTLLNFVNKQGLRGWELFAVASVHSMKTKVYHFRKQ